MNLFIIGNGFDMEHGLETTYYNFREYLVNEHCDFLIDLEKAYNCEPDSKSCAKERLWKEFEKNLANIDEVSIIEWGATIEMGLEGGDIDVFDHLVEYFNDMYCYIENLKKYLKQWVEQIELKTEKRTKKIRYNTEDRFLTFNYTLLLEEIYGIDKVQILHIHGSIDQDDEFAPDIGHGDCNKIKEAQEKSNEAWDELEEKEGAIYSAVANYYDRSLKDVSHYLLTHDSFFKQLSEIEEVFVIGHSLGGVDLPYLKKVLENVTDDTIWNIYFFRETERENLEKRIAEIGVKSGKYLLEHSSKFYDEKYNMTGINISNNSELDLPFKN